MSTYLIYIINILVIAFPLAIFEIITEKQFGWGSGWSKDKWYAKQFAPKSSVVKLLVKILRIEYPLNGHFVIFAITIPVIFVFEYFFWTNNILLLLSSFIGVVVFEDLFWFLFNWNFDSFKQLLKGPNGSIWWHKRWIKISKNNYLPASYFSALPISFVLLLLS